MELDFTPEQRKFCDELRVYFKEMMSDALVSELRTDGEGGGPLFRAAMRQMGSDGLLGVGWPTEFGGQGRTPMEQFIFADEVQSAGFPLPFLTLNTVGPTIMHYGTEEQKAEILPRVLAGEVFFAIGYSEPGAGTDLASLKTAAHREGEEWVINGQKMWTSLAGYSDYIWLAARTDPDAPKHRGLSMFLVPTTSEGYSRQKIMTLGGVTTNATFYDSVRVPEDALIGGENNGWSLITGQLNHERISLTSVGPIRRNLRDVVDWARETKIDGAPVIEKSWVRHNLARVYSKVQVVRLMNWKQAWAAQEGQPHPAAASAVKVFGSELNIEAYRALMEITSARGNIGADDPGAVLQGRIESAYRNCLILTFGGGTNEVQRDIIAMAGMGLPHYKH
ncbi:MAG: acyl-CoA dehydrogenase family protein [Myxococcota bacterium]|nr:acyl-CoA dehydrogenase family protein [Myxococcota bacterium]